MLLEQGVLQVAYAKGLATGTALGLLFITFDLTPATFGTGERSDKIPAASSSISGSPTYHPFLERLAILARCNAD